jgi:hypothetical protein
MEITGFRHPGHQPGLGVDEESTTVPVAEHPGVNGAFSVLEFPDPDDGRTVCVEALTSTLYLEQTRQVGIYRMAFEQIQAVVAAR